MTSQEYWVTSKMATGRVSVDTEMFITEVPPIWRKFYAQKFDNLIKWLEKVSDDVRYEEL